MSYIRILYFISLFIPFVILIRLYVFFSPSCEALWSTLFSMYSDWLLHFVLCTHLYFVHIEYFLRIYLKFVHWLMIYFANRQANQQTHESDIIGCLPWWSETDILFCLIHLLWSVHLEIPKTQLQRFITLAFSLNYKVRKKRYISTLLKYSSPSGGFIFVQCFRLDILIDANYIITKS